MLSTRKAEQANDRSVVRVSNGIVLVVVMELLAGIAVAATTNAEGPLGGVLVGAVYALPLACVALLLRSSQPVLRVGGGVLGGLFAFIYAALPVFNSIGGGTYTESELVRSIAVTVPAAIGGLGALWVAVLRRPRRCVKAPKRG